jgi:hypothetical protein
MKRPPQMVDGGLVGRRDSAVVVFDAAAVAPAADGDSGVAAELVTRRRRRKVAITLDIGRRRVAIFGEFLVGWLGR